MVVSFAFFQYRGIVRRRAAFVHGECVNATSKNKLEEYFTRVDKPTASLSWCHPNVNSMLLCTWGGRQ